MAQNKGTGRNIDPDLSTPAKRRQFVRLIRGEEEQTYKDIHKGETAWYLEDSYGTRREDAVLAYLDRAEEDFGSCGARSVAERFAKLELDGEGDYNELDDDAEIRIGAALFILDSLNRAGKIGDAIEILPDAAGDDRICWYLPFRFHHPVYTEELIENTVHLVTARYGRYRSPDDMYDCILTEQNAGRKKPDGDWKKLLDLLPQEEVERACRTFKEKLWELLGRQMRAEGYFDREQQNIIDALQPVMGRGPLATPAPADPFLPKTLDPGVLARGLKPSLPGLEAPVDVRSDAARLAGDLGDLMKQRLDYRERCDDYLLMSRKEIRRETGSRDIADALSGFTVEDPYALCFALLVLLDEGDDMPWLMKSGCSLMLFAVRMLPWHVDRLADFDPERLHAFHHPGIYDRNGWLEKKPPEEPCDWYHTKHGGRNLAQIIYELSAGIVPTGFHPFEEDRKRLIGEGMDERTAALVTERAEFLFLECNRRNPWYAEWSEGENLEEEEEEAGPDTAVGEEEKTEKAENGEKESPAADGKTGKKAAAQEQQGERTHAVPGDTGAGNGNAAAELKEAKEQIRSLKAALSRLRHEADAERGAAEEELKTLRQEHRELADLREYVFNRENEDEERPETASTGTPAQIRYPYTTRKRTVVFGGHETFLKTIRPMLPTVKFVDAANLNFSPDLIRNADVVWIQSNRMSHAQYYAVARQCRSAGVQMRYFTHASAGKCADQLVEEDQK